MTKQRFVFWFASGALLICGFASAAAATTRADALVLVNSASGRHDDFQHYIKPYLGNFGVPYTLLDIADMAVEASVADYALIIVGHKQLDPNGVYLSSVEQDTISAAVSAGTGLVNFDNDLSGDGSTGRYQFIEDIFRFGYVPTRTGSGVLFTSSASVVLTEIHRQPARFAVGRAAPACGHVIIERQTRI